MEEYPEITVMYMILGGLDTPIPSLEVNYNGSSHRPDSGVANGRRYQRLQRELNSPAIAEP